MRTWGRNRLWGFALLVMTTLLIVLPRLDSILLAVLPTKLELHVRFDCFISESRFGTDVNIRDDDMQCLYSRALIESATFGGYSVTSDESLIIVRNESAVKLFNDPESLDSAPQGMIDECMSELELAISDIGNLANAPSADNETTEDGFRRLICTRRAFI